jgi:dCMP deaminase
MTNTIINYDKLEKWDKRFLDLATHIATWSKDPNGQVGAVLISQDRKKISYGFNGFPSLIADDERLNSEDKNLLMVHAELNAILNAKTDLTHYTLYCTKTPCSNCATAIIQSGIKHVYCFAPRMSSKWFENQRLAQALFDEAGVFTHWVEN